MNTFLTTLFGPNDIVEARCIPIKEEMYNKVTNPTGKFIQRRWATLDRFVDLLSWLQAQNDNNLGVYVGVLPRVALGMAGDHNTAPSDVLWCDIDGGVTVEAALAAIKAAGLPEPTMVVFTGNGVHVYWKLTQKLEPRFLSTKVDKIIQQLKSDPTAKNEERVLRLPGFKNTKPGRGNIVEVVYCKPELRYDPAIFPNAEENPTAAIASPEFKERDWAADELMEVMRHAAAYVSKIDGAVKGTGQHLQSFKVACVLRREFQLPYDTALSMLVDWDAHKNNPPLGRDECIKQLGCAEKHGKSEVGCKVKVPATAIDDKGYSEKSSVVRDIVEIGAADYSENSKSLVGNRWWCRGQMNMLVAPPGLGKSTLLIQMLYYWAHAKPAFGLVPSKDLRIGVLNYENDDEEIQQMMAGLAYPKEHVYIIAPKGTGEKAVDQLSEETVKHNLDGWLIDPWFNFAGSNMNPDATASFLHGLLMPRIKELNVGALSAHHTPKHKPGGKDNGELYSPRLKAFGSVILSAASKGAILLEVDAAGSYYMHFDGRHERTGIVDINGNRINKVTIMRENGLWLPYHGTVMTGESVKVKEWIDKWAVELRARFAAKYGKIAKSRTEIATFVHNVISGKSGKGHYQDSQRWEGMAFTIWVGNNFEVLPNFDLVLREFSPTGPTGPKSSPSDQRESGTT